MMIMDKIISLRMLELTRIERNRISSVESKGDKMFVVTSLFFILSFRNSSLSIINPLTVEWTQLSLNPNGLSLVMMMMMMKVIVFLLLIFLIMFSLSLFHSQTMFKRYCHIVSLFLILYFFFISLFVFGFKLRSKNQREMIESGDVNEEKLLQKLISKPFNQS